MTTRRSDLRVVALHGVVMTNSQRRLASRRSDIAMVVVASATVLGAVVFALSPLFPDSSRAGRGGSAEWHAFSSSSASSSSSVEALWTVPAFAARDHRGAALSSASLAGRPYIANFIFTTCTNACPMMTSRLVLVQRGLVGVDVRFVSFSVDPAHDTAAAMAAYQQQWHADEARWSLVPTTTTLLAQLVDGFRIAVEATGDAADPILHSEVFFLVDGAGDVRGIYSSRDSDALARLQHDARALTSSSSSAAAAPTTLAGLGCLGCHASARIAPPLVNLRGAERTLSDGRTVVVDEAYLRRAITAPSDDVVAGYPKTMPNYRAQLDDMQLEMLVRELLARRDDNVVARTAAVKVVIDPVCKMEVRTEPDTPHAHVDGHDVWFCAEVCREAYVKNPAAYPLVAR